MNKIFDLITMNGVPVPASHQATFIALYVADIQRAMCRLRRHYRQQSSPSVS